MADSFRDLELREEVEIFTALADAIRNEDAFQTLRLYLEECSVWALRCHIAETREPLLPLIDALIVVPAKPLRELESSYRGGIQLLAEAFHALRTVIEEWKSDRDRDIERPTLISHTTRTISPPSALFRRSFSAVESGIEYYLNAIERQLRLASKASGMRIAIPKRGLCMLVLRRPAEVLLISDPHVRVSATRRFQKICAGELFQSDRHGFMIVVEPGDNVDATGQESGIAVLRDLFDEFGFGDPELEPMAESIADHGQVFELVFVFGDSGSGLTIFVPKTEGVDRELLDMCATFPALTKELEERENTAARGADRKVGFTQRLAEESDSER